MSDNWIRLETGKEVFDRQAEGWEIEFRSHETYEWRNWKGKVWEKDWLFQGRPRQQAVVYECYDIDGRLRWRHPRLVTHPDWTRLPQFDKILEAAE